ncbi:MAG: spermidine/putrescine ABC transporter substrate-binding protein [Neisseriales bacterium]|nr:MAG: spermidine/putrescine ABC transporter substrate-binding protein [Neisseriales bacterium]
MKNSLFLKGNYVVTRSFLGLVTVFFTSTVLANVLHLYNWNDYLPKTIAQAFETKYHCKISEDFYGDNEEMLAKLMAGARGYDIVVPTDYAVETLKKQKKIVPLNRGKLPNIRNLDKKYLHHHFNQSRLFSVPYAFTITMLGYNVTQLKKLGLHTKINTWALLFDPTLLKKMKGRVTVLDSQHELIAAALLYLGKNPNSTNLTDWLVASQVIIKAKPYWAAFNNQSYMKELAVGNIWVAMGYSSDFYQAKRYTERTKRAFQIDFGLQKEGNVLAMDSFVILCHSANESLAYQFINFMLEGKNAAALTNQLGLGNPNKAALPYIDYHVKKNHAILPSQAQMQNLYQLPELNMTQRRQLNHLWSKIKLR